MSLLIGDGLVVSLDYKLTDDEGDVIDSSEGGEPLSYLHGVGNIIPGLEKALVGKTEGDSLEITVQPDEGYGEVVPDLVQVLERSAFEGVDVIEVGMSFEGEGDDGVSQQIVVTEVEGDNITIDANHPLAGLVLHFEVVIVSIKEATEEELEHGHAH